jgi:hypothetical protein
METNRTERKNLVIGKARAELASLEARGVRLAGNAFSSVLLLKDDLSTDEQAGATPLSGQDGNALRAALAALGYAPEDWCAILTVGADGQTLDCELLREAICTLDPATVVVCDEGAAQALRETYADELASLDDFDAAMLVPGKVVRILGMRVLALGGFAAALADSHQKQVMWARLKQLPPLGEPY